MFAEKLKEWRKRKGISIYELASLIETSPTAISNWENNIRHPKRKYWERIIKISNGEISLEDLAGILRNTPAEAR